MLTINKKKFERGIYISTGVLAIVLMVIVYIVKKENRKLLKEGARSEATIIKKTENGRYSRKGRKKKHYYFDLAFFADTAMAKPDTFIATSNSIDDKMDALFDNIAAQRIVGDYTSKTLEVSSESYYKLEVGDKVKVIYYKDRPESAKLLSEVD